MHYDNQFLLLQEGLLVELRNDLQVAQGQKKGRKSAVSVGGLVFKGLDCGTQTRRKPCSLTFFCKKGLNPHKCDVLPIKMPLVVTRYILANVDHSQ